MRRLLLVLLFTLTAVPAFAQESGVKPGDEQLLVCFGYPQVCMPVDRLHIPDTSPIVFSGDVLAPPVMVRPVRLTRTWRQKADVGLGLFAIGGSAVAFSLTMACTVAKECIELNSRMEDWLGKGPVVSSLVNTGIDIGSIYAVWRLTPPGKLRTWLLGGLAAFNVADAVFDIRTMRTIERNRADRVVSFSMSFAIP